MNKISLCISGYAAKGRYGVKAYLEGYKHIKNMILDKYDVDVFIYSVEPTLESELKKIYKPVKSIFEEPKDFTNKWKSLNKIYSSANHGSVMSYPNLYNMMYGRYMVGQLKNEYEIKNNKKYDWVIFTRFDISIKSHIEKIYFNPNLDNNYIYSCSFNQTNAGIQDQWYYSNSKNINKIFSLFLYLEEYLKEDSDYIKSALNNWICSNINNRNSHELFLNDLEKSNVGEKIPREHLSNSHLLHKWHLYKQNLWNLNKLKFININNHLLNIEPHTNIININYEQ